MRLDDVKVGIVGLGYVGLPLAVEFGKKFNVLGFDHESSILYRKKLSSVMFS